MVQICTYTSHHRQSPFRLLFFFVISRSSRSRISQSLLRPKPTVVSSPSPRLEGSTRVEQSGDSSASRGDPPAPVPTVGSQGVITVWPSSSSFDGRLPNLSPWTARSGKAPQAANCWRQKGGGQEYLRSARAGAAAPPCLQGPSAPASNSYRLTFEHKDFFCWKASCQNISTRTRFLLMRPHDLLRAENTVSAEGNHSYSSSVQTTPEIEKKYVHRVYDAIAPHFSSTRFAKWPKVAGFLNSLRPGSIVLDAGCGNGKYLGFDPACFFIGCDISPPLIEICAGKGHEVLVADAVNLPYRDNFGDAAISIAVLHHLSTVDRRRKALEELVRVVKRGGLVLITVWAREQEDKALLNKWTPLCEKYNEEWVEQSSPLGHSRSSTSLESISENDEDTGVLKEIDQLNKKCDDFKDKTITGRSNSSIGEIDKTQQEYFVPWHLPFHRAEIGGASAAAVENGFAKKDEKKGAVVYNRYYHVFVEGELQRLVTGISNAAIVDQFYDKSNWCIVLEKL